MVLRRVPTEGANDLIVPCGDWRTQEPVDLLPLVLNAEALQIDGKAGSSPEQHRGDVPDNLKLGRIHGGVWGRPARATTIPKVSTFLECKTIQMLAKPAHGGARLDVGSPPRRDEGL
jgi:hypothetical protein